MSDRAQRVLDALMEYDKECGLEFPIQVISEFFNYENIELFEDYELLTVEEEKQVIKAFLEHSY